MDLSMSPATTGARPPDERGNGQAGGGRQASGTLLGPAQAAFFQAFGYLHVPGLLAGEIGWIAEEFAAVVAEVGGRPGGLRNLPFPFIDRRERFCRLLDLPAIEQLVELLLGPDANYLGSTGGYFVGETGWHRDGWQNVSQRMKVAVYLDEVRADTGSLRVVPASHAWGDGVTWPGSRLAGSKALWGIEQRDVPAMAIASSPGDVIVFDQTVLHASFGGAPDRKMFTMHFGRRCHTAEELAELEEHVATFPRFGITRLHSEVMRSTATPGRMRHLEQAIQVERRLHGFKAVVARTRFRREKRRMQRLGSG